MENKCFSYLNTDGLETLTKENERFMEIPKKIAIDVKNKKLTLLETVEKLEYLLTNQSFSKRELGILILSEALYIIGQISQTSNNFNIEQLDVLSTYFSEKLKDHHQVASAAFKGILALVNFPDIPSESIVLLVTSIFNHVTCQQQQQPDRYLIYQIYEAVLNKHTKEVSSMGIDFVYGIISSIDGERDPKNLVYLFNWLQIFLKTVKLGHLLEEMFEVLACYFPVDFKAPPSDKNKISREDLAVALGSCLTCIADFGPLGIPLALEKLDSSLKIAKEDSLDILKNGCQNYKTSDYYQHSLEIWSQIQKEIFNSTDEDLKKKCLETLKDIVKKLSEGDPKQFETTINYISDTLKGNLMPDSKYFPQSSQILIFVAQASQKSSVLVAKKVAPLLENTFKITKNQSQKSKILNTLIAFVKAVITNNTITDLARVEEIENVPVLCSQAIFDTDDKLQVEGFRGFTNITGLIPKNVCDIIFTHLHKLIVLPQKEIIKPSFFNCLEKMAEVYPQDFEQQVLHKEKVHVDSLDIYLESLSYIVKVPHFKNNITDIFINYILDNTSSSEIALKYLNNILTSITGMDSLLISKSFISRLTDFLVSLDDHENMTDSYLNNVNIVLQNTVKYQDKNMQKQIYSSETNRSFKNQKVYITVLSGLTVPMKKNVFDDYEKIQFLVDCSLYGNDTFIRNISLEVLANVLNKVDKDEVLNDNLSKIEVLCEGCHNEETKLSVLSWITKSLVTRNHPNAWHWTNKLLGCLSENIEAAKGFRLIMDERYLVLAKENHCQIMPLYKQKFFVYVTNKISNNFQNTNAAYYTVVGYLLEKTPKQAVIGQFKKILRLIILCLENCTEAEVLQIIVQRITDFVASNESVVEDNFEDIFLRVLNLTSFNACMGVRISAIECVHQVIMTYPVFKLLPFKQKVIQQLGMCVDDKKRLVRREAMEVRSLWYLLDAPE